MSLIWAAQSASMWSLPFMVPFGLSIQSPHQASHATVSVIFRGGNPQHLAHERAKIIVPWYELTRSVLIMFHPQKGLSPDGHAILGHPRHVLTRLRQPVRDTTRMFESSMRRVASCSTRCVQSLLCGFRVSRALQQVVGSCVSLITHARCLVTLTVRRVDRTC